jgi:hypothetical protein
MPNLRLAPTICTLTLLAGTGICSSPRQVKWPDLAAVILNKTVSVALADGAIVTGEAMGVESDALVVRVTKTSDAALHPKGALRISRPNLHVLELHTKRHVFRAILTPVGGVIGFAGGAGAAIGIQGGIFGNEHQGAAVGALIGITAGGTVAGYFIGNSADRHTTTIEIVP